MIKIINFIKQSKIALIIAILFFAIYYLISSNFESNKINASITDLKAKNPYVLITKWSAIIKRDKIIRLQEKAKEDIKLNDKIRTFDNSAATIFWPDWSLTRLWSKTSITIKELNTNPDLSTYKINFNLETGKTWSNIIKFLTDDSYFTETYDEWNYAATARGTVFEINLDDNYINAYSHDINLSDISNNKNYNIRQWEIVNAFDPLSNASAISIDKEWIEENITNDQKYLNSLLENWQKQVTSYAEKQTIGTKTISYLKYKTWINKDDYIIKNIAESLIKQNNNIVNETKNIIPQLSKENKEKLNSKLLSVYSAVHSLPNSSKIANYKSDIRDLIIQTWEGSNKIKDIKNRFLKLDIYDFVDLAKKEWGEQNKYLKNNIDKYLTQLKDASQIDELLWSFSGDVLGVLKNSFGNFNEDINVIIESSKNSNIKENIQQWIINQTEQFKENAWTIIWSIKDKIWN